MQSILNDKWMNMFNFERRKGMSKMKKKLVGVAVLAMVMSFVLSVPAFAEETFTVHANVVSDWGTPAIWAWSDPDLVNVFEAWPGQQLIAEEGKDGWFSYSIPTWANCVIINDNGAGKQTLNLPVEAKEVWITVTADNAEVVYEAPEGYAAVEVTEEAIVEDATADDSAAEVATTDVPKTGVVDFMYLYMGLAGLSGAGYIAVKKNRTK